MTPWQKAAVAIAACGMLVSCSNTTSPAAKDAARFALTPRSSTHRTGAVGTQVADVPSVLVLDSRSLRAAGVDITFVPRSTVDGPAQTIVRTGADGVATMAAWQVSEHVGTYSMFAVAPNGQSVEFVLIATPGPLATIIKFAGDNQLAFIQQTLAVQPTVRAVDRFGNPIAGVPVTFVVDSGDATLARSSTTTHADGLASADGWTFRSLGQQVLSARVAGFPPTRFTAEVIGPPNCDVSGALTVGVTFSAQLGPADCASTDGRLYRLYAVSPGADDAIVMSSSSFDTRIDLVDAQGSPIATNDNASGTTTNSVIRGVFVPGVVFALAGGARPAAGGAFTLGLTRVLPGDGCDVHFTMRGVSLVRVAYPLSWACLASGRPADRLRIYLRAGVPLSVSVQDRTASVWYGTLSKESDTAVLATLVPQSSYGGTQTLTFTAAENGYYAIDITSDDNNGLYTLTIR